MRCYGTGLQGVIACGCGEYTPLLWVGAGLHGVGLHCLQQWRTHHAAVGGAGLQSYVACGFGQVQSYGRQPNCRGKHEMPMVIVDRLSGGREHAHAHGGVPSQRLELAPPALTKEWYGMEAVK